MDDVTLFRLYVLRATYALIAVGLGLLIWPGIITGPADIEHARGVMRSLLGAVGLLALVGIRYPLQMLPLLLFELAWKGTWVLAYGLPLWSGGQLTPATRGTLSDCLVTLPILLLAIPWRYVGARYVRQPGPRWRGASPSVSAPG